MSDAVSSFDSGSANSSIDRVSARLQSQFQANRVAWKPYLRMDVPRYFGGTGTVAIGGENSIDTPVGSIQRRGGAGVNAKWNQRLISYATAG